MHTYNLYIASTGELIRTQESKDSLLVWQRRTEKKLLRYRRTPERVKQAIINDDTLAGWADYDQFVKDNPDSVGEEVKRVLRGYNRFIEKRDEARENANSDVVGHVQSA